MMDVQTVRYIFMTAPFKGVIFRRTMSKTTIDGLRDTLEDLGKAEDKYQTLRRRTEAITEAIHLLKE